jgi:enoyl-CoA hydratase
MEVIVDSLQSSETQAPRDAAAEIAHKSPSSLKVSLRALQEAERMDSLDEALAQELTIAMGCMRSADFAEGVRAAVIDKDRQPKWSPATLAEVSQELVDGYFV